MISKEQISEICLKIVQNIKPYKVILFGSYVTGNNNEDSDLDLIIVKETNLSKHQRAREIRKYLWGITDIPKDILVYTEKEINDWKNVKQAFITSVLINSKILYENKNRSIE